MSVGDVVNLNRIRKQRRRKAAEAKAAENRVRFGRSNAEKARQKADASRQRKELDGAELKAGNGIEGDPGSPGASGKT
ncbi:MAG: DUF4169 family protein [Minwuia sp.]|uniref:DUF4169 family protein n=1 Tax=Minwuia sp. TaxID=2493630 RepID=UPI003A8C3729